VLDAATGQLKGLPPFHPEGGIGKVAIAPDGRAVLIVDADHTARLWDVRTGKKLGPMPASAGAICPAFSPDGRHLAVGRQDGIIALWQRPQPLEGDPQRLRLWIEALTGFELDQDETLRSLSLPEQQFRRDRLEHLGGPPPLP
jgi:WD40 repeat protein